MKNRPIVFILILLALLVTACSPATPTPIWNSSASGDTSCEKIQKAGKIVFGTSADYAPYEYYDANFQLTGYDPALARSMASQLGIQVELKDYAFEGLGTALKNGDIDAAIAAISVTADRETQVDFSDVYFYNLDAVLARSGSGIKITAPDQLTAYQVGVQRGTTYKSYLQKTFVEPGLMPASNVLQYQKVDEAVRDLKESRNDLVLLGQLPAQQYVTAGGC